MADASRPPPQPLEFVASARPRTPLKDLGRDWLEGAKIIAVITLVAIAGTLIAFMVFGALGGVLLILTAVAAPSLKVALAAIYMRLGIALLIVAPAVVAPVMLGQILLSGQRRGR